MIEPDIYYKVVRNVTGTLMSVYNTSVYAVTFVQDQFVEASIGRILVFKDKAEAVSFAGTDPNLEVWECHCEDPVKAQSALRWYGENSNETTEFLRELSIFWRDEIFRLEANHAEHKLGTIKALFSTFAAEKVKLIRQAP